MGAYDVKELLPHRKPFLFIDSVLELEPGKKIVAVRRFDPDEGFFRGHFPGSPVVPGVIIIEAIAQAGGILVAQSEGERIKGRNPALVGLDRVRFRKPVLPGDEVRLEVEMLKSRERLWKLRGIAFVEGAKVAEADVTATLF